MAREDRGPRRVVIEKPFGTDLASGPRAERRRSTRSSPSSRSIASTTTWARRPCRTCWCCGSPTRIFEPIWNRNYIDHVQITAAEEVTVGHRAGYYDSAGVLRDMFQNHLLQLLTLTAMEAPARFEADAVRDEKVKVLPADPPHDAPRKWPPTRFAASIAGYRDEPGVAAGQPDGHLRRGQAARRQLALAGRAVLSPQRQGDVLPHHADRDPVSPAAAHDVRRRAAGSLSKPTGW